MTGSSRCTEIILQGAPVVEDAAGNVSLAIAGGVPAFAVALDGTPPGGIATWGTDGIVERKDWFLIAGTKWLTPGAAYFLSGVARLALDGEQQIGVARSKTELIIQILQPAPKVSQVWPVTSPPMEAVGKPGDIAYDIKAKAIYNKTSYGWGDAAYLVGAIYGRTAPPILVGGPSGFWSYGTATTIDGGGP